MQPARRVPCQRDRQQHNTKQRHPEVRCVICQYSLLCCIISFRNQNRAKGKAATASTCKYLKKTPWLEKAWTIDSEHSAPHQQLPTVTIRQETAGPERGSKEQLNISLLLEGLGQLPSRQQPVTIKYCYHVTRKPAGRGESWGRIRII